MNKGLIAGLVISLFVSQSSVASSLSNYDLERKIFEVSYQLNDIARVNKNDLCAGDVTIAAAYLESAGHEIQFNKYPQALVS